MVVDCECVVPVSRLEEVFSDVEVEASAVNAGVWAGVKAKVSAAVTTDSALPMPIP